MPQRILDGEAMWGSDRLLACPEDMRVEYAWLVPLADANGTFELNIPVIAGKVSAIRPAINQTRLKKIFKTFEANGLLFVWKSGQKSYGHWTLSEKPGRLPQMSHRERYGKLCPKVPQVLYLEYLNKFYHDLNHDKLMSNLMTDIMTGIGIGSGIGNGIGLGLGEDMPSATTKIKDICIKVLGVKPEQNGVGWTDVKALMRVHGSDMIIRYFEEWAEANRGDTFNGYPISEFAKIALAVIGSDGSFEKMPDKLQKLLDSIAEIAHTEVVFNSGQHAVLNKMLAEFGHDDVLSAFRIFYSEITDEYQLRFAAKNFIEQGPQRVRIVQKGRERRAEEERLVADSIAREKEKVNKVLEELEAKKAADTFLEEL